MILVDLDKLQSFAFLLFLVANMLFYKRLSPIVGQSVGPSVGLSVRPAVALSVSMSQIVGEQAFWKLLLYVCVVDMGIGVGGVNEGLMPLPTRLQRYCDPRYSFLCLFL